jgi:hypothetical protein
MKTVLLVLALLACIAAKKGDCATAYCGPEKKQCDKAWYPLYAINSKDQMTKCAAKFALSVDKGQSIKNA